MEIQKETLEYDSKNKKEEKKSDKKLEVKKVKSTK